MTQEQQEPHCGRHPERQRGCPDCIIVGLEARLAAAEQQAQTYKTALEEIANYDPRWVTGRVKDIARAALNPQSEGASDGA